MPTGVYTRTEKNKPSEAHKEAIRLANTGKKKSLETRKKLSESQKRIGNKPPSRKGAKMSEDAKTRIGLASRGHVVTEEIRRKISEKNKGRIRPEHLIKNRGEKNGMWKGGVKPTPYPVGWKESLREAIRIRDGNMCFECGVHTDEMSIKLSVHHIDYNKDNLDPQNLISLCSCCHGKTNYNRDYWKNYFKEANDNRRDN